jgi:hypothetical protein
MLPSSQELFRTHLYPRAVLVSQQDLTQMPSENISAVGKIFHSCFRDCTEIFYSLLWLQLIRHHPIKDVWGSGGIASPLLIFALDEGE